MSNWQNHIGLMKKISAVAKSCSMKDALEIFRNHTCGSVIIPDYELMTYIDDSVNISVFYNVCKALGISYSVFFSSVKEIPYTSNDVALACIYHIDKKRMRRIYGFGAEKKSALQIIKNIRFLPRTREHSSPQAKSEAIACFIHACGEDYDKTLKFAEYLGVINQEKLAEIAEYVRNQSRVTENSSAYNIDVGDPDSLIVGGSDLLYYKRKYTRNI